MLPMSQKQPGSSLAEHWENRYASSSKVWSGRPNVTLTQIAPELPVGRSLDLGCGEGADAIWLASQGWDATGIDLSPTAIERAREAARAAGLTNAHFEASDLETWNGEEQFDLVTAFFVDARRNPQRFRVLRRNAELVTPGGHLLIVCHAAFPPWAPASEQSHITPEQEIADLRLDQELWRTEIAEIRRRDATRPDGMPGTVDDMVVLLTRRA